MNCLYCGAPIEGSGGNRQKRYCKPACRQAAKRARDREKAAQSVPSGSVRRGLDDWLDERPRLPEALVTACEALADQVDEHRGDSALWSRYLSALAALTGASVDADREAQRLLADLRLDAHLGDVAERMRVERLREATARGDDAEARRWDRVVPIGCARGVHRMHRWPAGHAACLDCGVTPEELDAA